MSEPSIERRFTGDMWRTTGREEGRTAIVRGPFSFAYDTPDLTAGVAFDVPTVGDLLMDAWFLVDVAFNGTTPYADIGTFIGTTRGLWGPIGSVNRAYDLAIAGTENQGAGVFTGAGVNSGGQQSNTLSGLGAKNSEPVVPAPFTAANPLKLVVSQTGHSGGTAIGGSAGAARLYIATATPVAFS